MKNLKLVSRSESAGNPLLQLYFAEQTDSAGSMNPSQSHLTLHLDSVAAAQFVVGKTYALTLTPVE